MVADGLPAAAMHAELAQKLPGLDCQSFDEQVDARWYAQIQAHKPASLLWQGWTCRRNGM
eukprot:354782-Chlamydomonas_euryale.AAC.8